MQVRIRSQRAPYRRAGLKFTEAKAWQEVDALGLTLAQILTLTADQVLDIEGRPDAESEWERLPADMRAEARDFLASHGVQDARLDTLADEESLSALRAAMESYGGNARIQVIGDVPPGALLNSEGPTGAPALTDGTQSLGASGETRGSPSGEAAAGKPAASNAPPANKRKATPTK